jgi:hypothetical protein
MTKSSTVSPVDDLTYDLITVLQQKARALAAYDKYLSDADAEEDDELRDLFASMRQKDEEDVQVLKEALARRLDEDLGYVEDESEVEDADVEDVEDDEDDEDYEEEDDEDVEPLTAEGRGEPTPKPAR